MPIVFFRTATVWGRTLDAALDPFHHRSSELADTASDGGTSPTAIWGNRSRYMSITAIRVEWDDTEEVFLVDLEALKRGAQLNFTTETYRGDSYTYHTSSKFEPDAKGGGLLTLFYRAAQNRHLFGLDCRWGEALLWLNQRMLRGRVEWKDSAERGTNKKIYSTTEEEDSNWERLKPLASISKRDRVLVERAKRQQQKFRDRLLKIDPRCAITGEAQQNVLEAAHILSVELGGDDIESNGILLRADLHRLFDAQLFAISPTGRVRVSRELKSEHYRKLLREHSTLAKNTFARVRGAWGKRN
jgi:hypothetical protein